MGLAIEVGYLADMLANDDDGAKWFDEEMQKLNPVLSSLGLNPHVEPRDCPVFSAEMFGYSGLHYLRRIAAHLNLRGKLPPPGDDQSAKDPVVEEYYALLASPKQSLLDRLLGRRPAKREFDHLMFHSDAEGYYLPQEFSEVIFPPEALKTPGGMVGSSTRLAAETRRLATVLGLPLDIDPEDEEVWEAADSQGEGETIWKRYGVESFSCLRLHHAAQHSIKHAAAIVFT